MELIVREGGKVVVLYRGPAHAIPFGRLPQLVVDALDACTPEVEEHVAPILPMRKPAG